MTRSVLSCALVLALSAGALTGPGGPRCLGAERSEAATPRTQPREFHVAPGGNDAWPGTADRPFATPARAQAAVRGQIKAGLAHDVTVRLHAGTYYVPKGLVFTEADSGTARCAVTYAAAPGERARLVGGVRVTGWRAHRGHVQVADMPAGAAPGQLFENGLRMPLARTPNEGYFRMVRAVRGKEQSAFVYRQGDVRPDGWDTSSASVFLWPGHDWYSRTKPLAAIDATTRTVTLVGTDGYAMKPGNRYFIQNALALLDQPGECVLDTRARRIYAWPRTKTSDRQEYVASTADGLLVIHGRRNGKAVVRNLHFRDLDLCISDGDVVTVTGAEDCSICSCLIEGGRQRGVYVRGWAQRVTIEGNLIRRHGMHGVELQGPGPGRPDVNHHHVVGNNHIHHCGRLVGHGYGVRISQSGHNRIEHNHIHHMPRYGITIKGTRYQVLRKQVKGVTFANRHEFLHSRNNLIAYNHVHHTNQDSQDTGALESWGPGRDNVYDHNLIHDTGNDRFNIQMGIYLDDATDYFTVTNNIIYNVVGTSHSQPIYAKGIGNKISNNILVVGPRCRAGISSFAMARERCDHHEYTHNIIVFEGTPQRHGRFGTGVGNLHAKGKTLRWKVNIPAAGTYAVWLRYAADNARYGAKNMDGRFTLQLGDAKPVTLTNVPNTGGWGVQQWHRVATIIARAGRQEMVWTNVRGGGINMDGWVLCTDSAWQPEGIDLPKTPKGARRVVVQAELHERDDADRRALYHFQNWSDDRVTKCDYNLYYKPHGPLTIAGGPADGSYAKWRTILNGRFDAHSIAADPRFVDLAGRDFRLRPDSPALKLGFQPIDTSKIGLRADFPKRLERE